MERNGNKEIVVTKYDDMSIELPQRPGGDGKLNKISTLLNRDEAKKHDIHDQSEYRTKKTIQRMLVRTATSK